MRLIDDLEGTIRFFTEERGMSLREIRTYAETVKASGMTRSVRVRAAALVHLLEERIEEGASEAELKEMPETEAMESALFEGSL